MTTSGVPLDSPIAAFKTSPIVHEIYAASTDTWQYIVADDTTLHCIVLDPVRDRCADPAAMSTSAADAIIAVVKERGYIVDYILETHAASPHCLSAAWYLRMQMSIVQGHIPQLFNEATVSGLELMWQRKYGAGSAFSTTIRAGLDDGGIITLGRLSLKCMHMPGFGNPHRRAYLVGNDIFGAHSIATLREDFKHTNLESIAVRAADDPLEDSVHHRDAWDSMQRVLSLPAGTRVWREQGDGSVSTSSTQCDSVAQCAALNKYAKSTEAEFLADMRVQTTLCQLAQAHPNADNGWKSRIGSWFSL